MSKVASALEFAELGCRIIPARGKEPGGYFGKRWHDKATRELDVMREWWSTWPSANVAILPDRALLPVDVDDAVSFERFQEEHGRAPSTPRYLTGGVSGRERLLFAYPGDDALAGARRKLAEGVQLRHANTTALICVVPPGVNPDSGADYEWTTALDEVPLAPLPAAWLNCIKPRSSRFGQPRGRPMSEWVGSLREKDAQQRLEDKQEAKGGRPPSAATLLASLALEEVELFHDALLDCYATVTRDGVRQTLPLRSKRFHGFLVTRFRELHGKVPGGQALHDAIGQLEGYAAYVAPEHPVHVRLAEHAGHVYLDLGDETWRAVEIDAEGWRIVKQPPVRFRRTAPLRRLPEPRPGGDLEEFRGLLNVDDHAWALVLGWLIGALRPRGPYPLLEVHGEHGVAKSTVTRLLRSVFDPRKPSTRGLPKEEKDLLIAARTGWVIALDNISTLPTWLSDGLCRVATGAGYETRELFTDLDEIVIEACRPLVLNGIELVATRGDLLDRTTLVELQPIDDSKRQEEGDIFAQFDELHPQVLVKLVRQKEWPKSPVAAVEVV